MTLPELDAPLVEGVDAPDGALDEDGVLVERDELAEDRRRELRGEDGRARAGCPASPCAARRAAGVPSAAISSAVLPKASAFVWARQLAMRRSCCSPVSWVDSAKAMKSAGISFVPWWISW